jgi:hypothetical protein
MMVLNIHLPGATSYEIGDEIWQESLADALRAEAEIIAAYAGADLLESPDQAHRDALRNRLTVEMTDALAQIGDQYRSPDGVLYSLTDQPVLDACAPEASLTPMSHPAPSPTVEEVLRFEDLPLGSPGTRRAVVRWSGGTASETMTWYGDEIMICEGDLIGKTAEQLRSLHFRRDLDWLQS